MMVIVSRGISRGALSAVSVLLLHLPDVMAVLLVVLMPVPVLRGRVNRLRTDDQHARVKRKAFGLGGGCEKDACGEGKNNGKSLHVCSPFVNKA